MSHWWRLKPSHTSAFTKLMNKLHSSDDRLTLTTKRSFNIWEFVSRISLGNWFLVTETCQRFKATLYMFNVTSFRTHFRHIIQSSSLLTLLLLVCVFTGYSRGTDLLDDRWHQYSTFFYQDSCIWCVFWSYSVHTVQGWRAAGM